MADKPSGAEYAKARRQRAEALEAERIANGTDPTINAFLKLGEPPIDDPVLALGWYRKALLTCGWLTMTQPLTETLRERVRMVREVGAVIGMTHSKAVVETRLRTLEDSARGPANRRSNARPATSPEPASPALRAGRKAKRRSPVSGSMPGDQDPEGGDDPEGGGPMGSAP